MDRFNIDLYVLVLLSLSITSCLGLDKGIAADSDRLARIEDLLETVINTNKELEKRVKHLETELQEQKVLNDEMLDRIYELEATQRIDTNSEQLERNATTETPDRHNAVNGRSNQAYLWTERNNFPNIKQNHHHGNKSKSICVCFSNKS